MKNDGDTSDNICPYHGIRDTSDLNRAHNYPDLVLVESISIVDDLKNDIKFLIPDLVNCSSVNEIRNLLTCNLCKYLNFSKNLKDEDKYIALQWMSKYVKGYKEMENSNDNIYLVDLIKSNPAIISLIGEFGYLNPLPEILNNIKNSIDEGINIKNFNAKHSYQLAKQQISELTFIEGQVRCMGTEVTSVYIFSYAYSYTLKLLGYENWSLKSCTVQDLKKEVLEIVGSEE